VTDPRTRKAESTVRRYALAYPEAYEEFPWGERAIKVRKKVFVFMYAADVGLYITVKLPTSNAAALMQPFAGPAGYGLARAGWVTCKFPPDVDAPIDVLRDWIDESYRAVAPKSLSRALPPLRS
jgi:predicted DNA-binding protein (MmcQ/YjbR family)